MRETINLNLNEQQKEEDIQEVEEEEKFDKQIEEDPKKFCGWFEDLKNKLFSGDWKELFKNKKVRNALIIASIPLAVFKASGDVLAETDKEVMSELKSRTAITEKIDKDIPQRITPESLVSIDSKEEKIEMAQNINYELKAFKDLSDNLKQGTELEESDFDLSDRMEDNIKEANSHFEKVSQIQDNNSREKEVEIHTKKILENGKLNFSNLAKTFPEILSCFQAYYLRHEIGHRDEVESQGGKIEGFEVGFLSGEYKTNIKVQASIAAAGINANREFGKFLTECLRSDDSPSQLNAIMALVAKSDGMLYSLKTNFSSERDNDMNDILRYAEETGTSVQELAIGLAADFLFDRDNWQLMKVALGQDGAKISESVLKPFYRLGEKGPEYGIEFTKKF